MYRLGIFVFYDAHGIADSYVDHALKELCRVCQEIIFVVNGFIRQQDLKRLKKYVTDVYTRSNKGYDAGAYKDVLLRHIKRPMWQKYDEMVLMNDTSFGPVHSYEQVWYEGKEERADFWGFTRHPKMELGEGKILDSHIQSYFLAIGKKMTLDPRFLKFWEELPYPEDYQNAIDTFELKFTRYFEEKGFKSKALTDDLEMQWDGNPYLCRSYELITNKKLPFLKKKCLIFEEQGYENVLDAVAYIQENCKFDMDKVWEHLLRLCKEGRFPSILNYYELEIFYKSYDRIFIFGAGRYGKRMQKYFQCRNWKFMKFLTSGGVFEAESFEKTDGIILALGRANTKEVMGNVRKRFAPEQIFSFHFNED